MYRNGADALRHLLSGDSVRRIDSTSTSMQNGIAHCVVQVTLAGGEEYRIEDYGDDAEELCKTAKEHSALLLHA